MSRKRAIEFLVVGLVALCGCRAPAAKTGGGGGAAPTGAAAPAPRAVIAWQGRADAKREFQDVLLRAVKPKITHVDQVDGQQLRYRSSGFLGRGRTFSLHMFQFGRAEVTKRVWAFVYEKNGRRVDKVRFHTADEAQRYCDMLAHLASPEFAAISKAEKDAERDAALTPQQAPTPTQPAPANDAPCGICGEPRGDLQTCPHCGMD